MTVTLSPHTHQVDGAGACPYHRRAAEPTNFDSPAVEQGADGVWYIRGYKEARIILRNDLAHQAGFLSEFAHKSGMLKRLPVLFMEGQDHLTMRQDTGKFFTPSTVDKSYKPMIEAFGDTLIERLKEKGRGELSTLAMQLAVKVTGRVLGLTDSRIPGAAGRLNGILNNTDSLTKSGLSFLTGQVKMNANLLAFYWLDVKPSLKTRRANPQSDVFSYLIDRGYSDLDLLTEAIMYGVAGMVTTREFMCAAMWHLMERPDLREVMLTGSDDERYGVLGEILRLEPVVGDLYRRTAAEVTLETDGRTVTIPKGALVALSVVAANADETVVGENPHALCPARPLAEMRPKVPEYLLGFGDGDHKCPGSYIALRVSDSFIRKLLAIPTLRIEKGPSRTYNETIRSYELRDMILTV